MPGRLISTIALCGSILFLHIGDASAASKTVRKPMLNGNRLDWCLKWSSDCGKAAADAYCVAQGFQSAVDFKPDPHIGAATPTRLIGTGAICDLAHCDGFRQITCEKIPLVRPASVTSRKPLALQRVSLIQPVSLVAPLPPAKPVTIAREAISPPAASPGTPLPAAMKEQTETEQTEADATETASVSESVALPALPPPPKLFDKPMYNGKRLDWCHSWDKDCGQVAADAFCKTNGFTRAKAFLQDPHIGDAQPTRVIANGAVCDQAVCNGFKAITCAM